MNTDLAAQKSLDRMAHHGVEALTEAGKDAGCCLAVRRRCQQQRLRRIFLSPRGDLAFYAPAALRQIDAKQLADIATQANTVFGAGGPPTDHGAPQNGVGMKAKCFVALYFALLAGPLLAADDSISLVQVPAAVRKTIEDARDRGPPRRIMMRTISGRIVYDVELERTRAVNLWLRTAVNGTILWPPAARK